MKTLKMIFDTNQPHESSELKRMNVAFAEEGRNNGHTFMIGEKECFVDEAQVEVELIQAVEVNDDFVALLKDLGATMEPTLKELDAHFLKHGKPEGIPLFIRSNDVTYKGAVGMDILSKTLSYWTDTTEWKEV